MEDEETTKYRGPTLDQKTHLTGELVVVPGIAAVRFFV